MNGNNQNIKGDNKNTKEKFVCTECGEKFDREELTAFEGTTLCRNCLEELTTICRCCGTRIWTSDAILYRGFRRRKKN